MNEIAQIDQAARELDLARARIAELERELDLRKTDAEQLRSSEEKYRTLVESSSYCIKIVDGDGRLLSMNRAGLEMVVERGVDEHLAALGGSTWRVRAIPGGDGTQQIGFYSYGEISPFASGHCDLHNQTMTLTTIGED